MLRTYATLYMVFLFAPIVLLPIFAFNAGTIVAFPLQGFTSDWFAALWEREALHKALRNTLTIALIAATLSTILGICAARAGAMAHFRGKRTITGLIMLPLVLPEIIVAVSFLIVLRQVLGVQLGSWTIIAAHTLICTPFCTAILNGAFQNIDPSLEEAALDLGETRWSAFRLILLPIVMPGIISAFLIAFIISVDEFIIAFFLSGAGETLPVYIYSLARFPSDVPIIMALGTLLVVSSIILLAIAEVARRSGLKRAGVKDSGGFL